MIPDLLGEEIRQGPEDSIGEEFSELNVILQDVTLHRAL